MATRDAHELVLAAVPPSKARDGEVMRGTPANDAKQGAPESHIRSRIANDAERMKSRSSLGARFARNQEMAGQLLQIETAMDALAERSGVASVVDYVHRFTVSARAVEHALSLTLRTSLSLLTKHGKVPPSPMFACVDAVHGWFFDLAEHIAELIDLQGSSRGAWGIPGRFLPEYSASYVSCKIEPAIEALLIEYERLAAKRELELAGAVLISAVDRLCEAVTTLNEDLRIRV